MTYLKLPDDYVMSNRLKNTSNSELVKILHIGEFIYFEGYSSFTKDTYEQKYEHMKCILEKEHLHALSLEAVKTQHLIEHNNNLQSNIDQLREDYKESIDSVKIEHENQIKEANTLIQNLQNELKSISQESHNTILSKMESLLGYGNTIDNIEKGNYGENYVSNHILELFPESNLVDVSGLTASGDIIWEMAEDFKCLVEVKNVSHSKNLNIDKFVRDMNHNSAQNYANCGLFVSLKTENVPFKGKLKLEFVNNCPVIYVSNVFKCPSSLQYAMYMIKEIHNYVSKYHNNEENDTQQDVNQTISAISIYFDKLKSDFNTQNNLMDDLKKNIDRLLASFGKLQKNLSVIVRDHMYQMRNYNLNDSSETNKAFIKNMSIDQCIDIVLNYYNEYGKFPSGPNSGISPYYRRSFGYKNILNEAQKKISSD